MDYHWTSEAVTSEWNTHGLNQKAITETYILAQILSTGVYHLREYRPWGAEDNQQNGYKTNSWRAAIDEAIERYPECGYELR